MFCFVVPLDLKLGKKVNEGKTKEVYELPDIPGCVLMQSKDQITAGNAARKDRMEGKAAISNTTTSCVFQLLQEAGQYFKSRVCMLVCSRNYYETVLFYKTVQPALRLLRFF